MEQVPFVDLNDPQSYLSSLLIPEEETLKNIQILESLHAEELPKEAVALDYESEIEWSQIWQDKLIPLASDSTNDLTLYGLVDSDWVAETRKTAKTLTPNWDMSKPLLILRHGNDLIGCALSWYGNAWTFTNPWMEIGDFDGDGKENEVAVYTNVASESFTNYNQLGIYNLDTRKSSIVDISNLDVWADIDQERKQVTLYAGTYTMTLPVPDYIYEEGEPKLSISYGECVYYDYNKYNLNGEELNCTAAIAIFDETEGLPSYFATVTTSIVAGRDGSDIKYELGPVLSISAG